MAIFRQQPPSLSFCRQSARNHPSVWGASAEHRGLLEGPIAFFSLLAATKRSAKQGYRLFHQPLESLAGFLIKFLLGGCRTPIMDRIERCN